MAPSWSGLVPDSMIEETKALLLERGADRKQIHYEKYY